MPAFSADSGPIAARVAPIDSAYSTIESPSVSSISAYPSASDAIPGFRLEAHAYSSAASDPATARAMACSRPPPPTRSTVSVIRESATHGRVNVVLRRRVAVHERGYGTGRGPPSNRERAGQSDRVTI